MEYNIDNVPHGDIANFLEQLIRRNELNFVFALAFSC